MKRVLLDSSTVIGAEELLSGGARPTASNVFGLALFLECVVLHDNLLVLATADAETIEQAASRLLPSELLEVKRIGPQGILDAYVLRAVPGSDAWIGRRPVTPWDVERDHKSSFSDAERQIREVLYHTARDEELRHYLGELTGLRQAEVKDFHPKLGSAARRLPDAVRNTRPAKAVATAYDIYGDLRATFGNDKDVARRGSSLSSMTGDRGTLSAGWDFVAWYTNAGSDSVWQQSKSSSLRRLNALSDTLALRTYLYIMASEAFDAPYRPDALRVPIAQKYFAPQMSLSTEEKYTDVAESYMRRWSNEVHLITSTPLTVAPLFLARILAESSAPSDMLGIAMQIRESDAARRFRAHLRELEKAQEGEEIRVLMREVRDLGVVLQQAAGDGRTEPDVAIRLATTASKALVMQDPGSFIDVGAASAEALFGVPEAFRMMRYRRKTALLSRTLRLASRAQGMQASLSRVFGSRLSERDLAVLRLVDGVDQAAGGLTRGQPHG